MLVLLLSFEFVFLCFVLSTARSRGRFAVGHQKEQSEDVLRSGQTNTNAVLPIRMFCACSSDFVCCGCVCSAISAALTCE